MREEKGSKSASAPEENTNKSALYIYGWSDTGYNLGLGSNLKAFWIDTYHIFYYYEK